MSEKVDMSDMGFYVAEDPKQPGAAFACVVDDPKYPKDTAKDVADFIRRGGIVQRVDRETAVAMLGRWKRPTVEPVEGGEG